MKLDWVQHKEPEYEMKKFGIRIVRVIAWAESQRRHLLEDIQWTDQAQRENICVADWRWRIIFIKNAMQEVAEKLKSWEYADMRKETTKNNEDWKNFLRSMIGDREQWVYSSTILTYWAVITVPPFLIKLLLPRVQESLDAKLDASKYTKEFEYSRQRFWLSTCSTRSWWVTQWFKKFGDVIGDSEKRRNWE